MIFLSYAHEQQPVAEETGLALTVRDFDVFFDRSSLPTGVEYDLAIESAIGRCELFVFLVSPASVTPGTYALTELGHAKARWRNPSGRVLPVVVASTLSTHIDPYLRAVTMLYPQGSVAAEVASRVQAMVRQATAGDAAGPPTDGDADAFERHDAEGPLLLERMAAYRGLWSLTRRLPRWPRDDSVQYGDLHDLSAALRHWYFGDGSGMFLSRPAHTAYAALQDSLAAVLATTPQGLITDEHYDAIRDLCSALRSRLARDIGSRA